MAADKIPNGHFFGAFELDSQKFQMALGARHVYRPVLLIHHPNIYLLVAVIGLALRNFAIGDFERPSAEIARALSPCPKGLLGLAAKGRSNIGSGTPNCPNPRPNVKCPKLVVNLFGVFAPVNPAVFFGNFFGKRRPAVVLLCWLDFPSQVIRQDFDQKFCPQSSQSVMQFPVSSVFRFSLFAFGYYRPVVNLLVNFYNRDPGLFIAVKQSGLNWRRTAVFGQKRGVNVEDTLWEKVDNLWRNYFAVGSDDTENSLK